MLLDKIDNLQKIIFSYLRPAANNECRISALVPLIEESYNIYKFLQSMLMAMHKIKIFKNNKIYFILFYFIFYFFFFNFEY